MMMSHARASHSDQKERRRLGRTQLPARQRLCPWQRQLGKHGQFFPLHDLTHYAVETILGRRRGFYGMVAEGWDITDFGAPWPKGRLPADADPSELIVGFLDLERAAGERFSADDFMDKAQDYFAQHGVASECRITEAELDAIRARRSELFAQWHALPAGATFELPFDRATHGTLDRE